MRIKIEGIAGVLIILFLAYVAGAMLFGILGMTLGRALSYVVVGTVGYAIGRGT